MTPASCHRLHGWKMQSVVCEKLPSPLLAQSARGCQIHIPKGNKGSVTSPRGSECGCRCSPGPHVVPVQGDQALPWVPKAWVFVSWGFFRFWGPIKHTLPTKHCGSELSRQIHTLYLCFFIISLPLLVFRAYSFLVTVSLGFHPF